MFAGGVGDGAVAFSFCVFLTRTGAPIVMPVMLIRSFDPIGFAFWGRFWPTGAVALVGGGGRG